MLETLNKTYTDAEEERVNRGIATRVRDPIATVAPLSRTPLHRWHRLREGGIGQLNISSALQ